MKRLIIISLIFSITLLSRSEGTMTLMRIDADTATSLSPGQDSNDLAIATAHILRDDNPHAVNPSQIGAATPDIATNAAISVLSNAWPYIVSGSDVFGGSTVTNLDTITRTGFYVCGANSVGSPYSNSSAYVIHQTLSSSRSMQIAFSGNVLAPDIFVRAKELFWSTWSGGADLAEIGRLSGLNDNIMTLLAAKTSYAVSTNTATAVVSAWVPSWWSTESANWTPVTLTITVDGMTGTLSSNLVFNTGYGPRISALETKTNGWNFAAGEIYTKPSFVQATNIVSSVVSATGWEGRITALEAGGSSASPSVIYPIVDSVATVPVSSTQQVYRVAVSSASAISADFSALNLGSTNWAQVQVCVDIQNTQACVSAWSTNQLFDAGDGFSCTGKYWFAAESTGGRVIVRQTYPEIPEWSIPGVSAPGGIYSQLAGVQPLSSAELTNSISFRVSRSKEPVIVKIQLIVNWDSVEVDVYGQYNLYGAWNSPVTYLGHISSPAAWFAPVLKIICPPTNYTYSYGDGEFVRTLRFSRDASKTQALILNVLETRLLNDLERRVYDAGGWPSAFRP